MGTDNGSRAIMSGKKRPNSTGLEKQQQQQQNVQVPLGCGAMHEMSGN